MRMSYRRSLFLVAFFSVCEGNGCYLTNKKDGNGCWKLMTDTDSQDCDVIKFGGYSDTSSDNIASRKDVTTEEPPATVSQTSSVVYTTQVSNKDVTIEEPPTTVSQTSPVVYTTQAADKDVATEEPSTTVSQTSSVIYTTQVFKKDLTTEELPATVIQTSPVVHTTQASKIDATTEEPRTTVSKISSKVYTSQASKKDVTTEEPSTNVSQTSSVVYTTQAFMEDVTTEEFQTTVIHTSPVVYTTQVSGRDVSTKKPSTTVSQISSVVYTTQASMENVTTEESQTTVGQSSPVAYPTQASMEGVTTKEDTAVNRTSPAFPSNIVCPLGYMPFKTSCYKFVNDTLLSRSASRSACEADSAHLVFINSEEESDFVEEQTSSYAGYWIGVNGHAGHYYWDNGLNLYWGTFHSFTNAEISTLSDVSKCFIYIQKESISWRDESCFEHFGYICEHEANQPTFQCPSDSYSCTNETTDVNPSDISIRFPVLNTSTLEYFDGYPYELQKVNLTEGNHHFVPVSGGRWCSFMIDTECVNWTEWSNSAYHYVDTKLTWNAAAEACNFYGKEANLVSIQSQEENDFVKSLNKSTDTDKFWIGLSDQEEEGVWRWFDGSTANFFNWLPAEPNNYLNAQHCTILSTADGKWNDRACDGKQHFTCEKELH